MRIHVLMLAGAGFLAMAGSAWAQRSTDPGPQGASSTPDQGLDEIVVTARRKEELLEDVPQTVDVITADTVEKYNLLNFQDVQTIAMDRRQSIFRS